MSIVIEAGGLGARLRSDATGLPKVIQRAMFSAAQRGKAFLVDKSPVDRGILKNAWRIVKMSDGVMIVNDQPYAGVMEQGARPFKIGREGLEALTAWVMRKLKSGDFRSSLSKKATISNASGSVKVNYGKRRRSKTLDREAESIAWAIAKTFEKQGIKGRRFVYMNLPKLAELMDDEINRYLDRFFNRGSGQKE